MVWSILLGLLLGVGLNSIILMQLRTIDAPVDAQTQLTQRLSILKLVPRYTWILLVAQLLTIAMAFSLWQRYGWTVQFGLLLAAVLLLINTAVIDWQVKLIDTLVLLGASVLVVILAPWIIGSWQLSLLGLVFAGFTFTLLFAIAKMLYPQQRAPFGLGDVYLAMFIGALLGLAQMGAALLYGMLLAGAASLLLIAMFGYARARHIPIAYGSFLCIGTLLYLAIWPV